MAARYVVDTNLLVYALDRREPENEPVGRNEARLLKTRYHREGFRLTLEYPVDRFEGA